MFKTIDGQLSTIFSKVENINVGFNESNKEINNLVDYFNKINSSQIFDDNWADFINNVSSKNQNVANMFENLAKQGASAQASVEGVYAAILQGNTTGFMNVKSIIETFNSVDSSHQQDFAKAVGQTNKNLGTYLSNVQDGSASMAGYGKQLVATTAKTALLTAGTAALNAIASLGITALVSLAVYGVSKLVGLSKEVSEGIKNANEAYSKTSDSIKSIEEYKDKITELKKTLDDETTSEEDAYNARKQLIEIQDEVVAKYGLQKDSIDLVNGSLREEIELLDEVARKKSSDFLMENKESIDKAKKEVEKEKSFSVSFTKSSRSELSDFQDFLLSQGAMSQRIDRAGITSLDSDFTGTTDEAIEHYTELFECIQKYKNDHIDVLSQSQEGLDYVDSMLTGISNKINKINDEDYQNAKQLYDSATQSELQSNDNYRNIYKATIDARQDYQEAIAQGNENAIYKSLTDMEKAKADFQESLNNGKIVDLGVSEWFTDFYKDFETESGKYQFTVDIKTNSDGLKNSVQEALSYFGDKTPTKLDILNLEFKGSEQAQTAFKSLDSIAEQYGMTIEDLISILEDLEIVQIDEKDIDVTGQIVSEVKSSLAKVQAEIEEIFKNSDIFDKAIESINNGESVDFDTMMSMVEVDSSLADKFTKTADGYTIAVGTLTNARQEYIRSTQEQLQADIALSKQQAVIAEQNIKDLEAKREALLSHGINSKSDAELLNQYNTAIESEKEHLQDLNDVASKSALYLSELASSASSTVSCFEKSQNAISGMEEKTALLKKAMTEMRDTGSISADTYAELASKGEDYVNCLEIQNGKLVLNTEKLKDLDTAALKAAITTNELAMAQINASMAGHEWSEALKAEYNNIELATAALRGKLNEYNNTNPDKDKTPESITNFETELARRQHEIKMGRMEEDASYFDWLEKAYIEAYKGLTGYQDDIYKYEEMVYDGRQKLAEDFYNEQKKYHDNRVDELESQITVAEDKSVDSDGNSLNPAEKFDYIRASYSEIISEIERRINEIIQVGIEGHEDEVKELEKQIEEYSDKLQDVFKDEIEYEIDYIEITRDKYNDFIDSRIDRYEDEKKAIEDRYDTEIKSIDDTIDALKGKNEVASKSIELKKALQDLENSKQRTRMVYGADGTVSYRQDTDKVEEAQQKVDDLKLDMLIDSLEKQKEAVEGEKETALNKYDTMIDTLNEQKDKQSNYYNSLLEILNAYLNPNANENLDTVFERIFADKNNVKTEDGTTVVNGNVIDTSNVDSGKLNGDKVNDQLKPVDIDKFMKDLYAKSGTTPDAYDRWKCGEFGDPFNLLPNLFSYNNIAQNGANDIIKNITENRVISNSQPASFSFGDINITNPVGDAKQLAEEVKGQIYKEAMMELPNAFQKQMYTNLK